MRKMNRPYGARRPTSQSRLLIKKADENKQRDIKGIDKQRGYRLNNKSTP